MSNIFILLKYTAW